MSTQDHTARLLASTVEDAINDGNLRNFQLYWSLYKRTVDVSKITKFFVRTETQNFLGGYCNVAIMADGLIIDIEGDDNRNEGNLAVHSLTSIIGVSVQAGPLPGMAGSQGARIVALADLVGHVDEGLTWIAKTPEEEDRLLDLVKCLIESISTR